MLLRRSFSSGSPFLLLLFFSLSVRIFTRCSNHLHKGFCVGYQGSKVTISRAKSRAARSHLSHHLYSPDIKSFYKDTHDIYTWHYYHSSSHHRISSAAASLKVGKFQQQLQREQSLFFSNHARKVAGPSDLCTTAQGPLHARLFQQPTAKLNSNFSSDPHHTKRGKREELSRRG